VSGVNNKRKKEKGSRKTETHLCWPVVVVPALGTLPLLPAELNPPPPETKLETIPMPIPAPGSRRLAGVMICPVERGTPFPRGRRPEVPLELQGAVGGAEGRFDGVVEERGRLEC
jgi:hypothetical protein